MKEKLREIEQKFERLTAELSDPEVLGDSARLKRVSKERASLEKLVETYRESVSVDQQVAEAEAMLEDKDPDMRAMAREELPGLRERKATLDEELKVLLLPKDPNDDRDVIVEIRAGAGGDEAGLFAGELMRSYLRYAERVGWKTELLDVSDGGAGGVKDASIAISGDNVFSTLKFESGVHRVQRVPATEAQGRIHTSTVTVAVMPEVDEIDVKINPADLQWDVMRSTGAGGQSVNTTDSAVRVTHVPTNTIVKCQQEKSQQKNRAMALKLLRAKLYEVEMTRQKNAVDAARKSQVGSGDRSEKIRTYNFPQDRCTDHRIGLTVHNLPAIMDGDLTDVFTALRTHYQAERLREEIGGLPPGNGLSA
jgi:peptide chain release factor 1